MSAIAIPVSLLRNVWDVIENPPWNDWNSSFKPVTEVDVRKAVQQKDWTSRHMHPLEHNLELMELDHVRRIAWMVIHPPQDPILIDTHMAKLTMDGFHRFYAAIIRGDEMIDVSICGCDNEIAFLFGNDVLEQICGATSNLGKRMTALTVPF